MNSNNIIESPFSAVKNQASLPQKILAMKAFLALLLAVATAQAFP